mmetsp:Transcript_28662/g.46140  ORF Transcript_28662/g.46140 Transcript_28662/m.46140 type:complete len:237 (-) Transcript_28662:123-833(-)
MNGSSFGLYRYRLVLIAIIARTGVVAVTSLSAQTAVPGVTTVGSGHRRSECDITDVPANVLGESEGVKPMVMLQHETLHSVGFNLARVTDPPAHVENSVTITPNVSAETRGTASANVVHVKSASTPGSNITSKTLALEATVSTAVDASGARSNDTREKDASADAVRSRYTETRKKRHKVQKKREVTYWDKLPIFFASAAIPLLCLVARSNTGSSKCDSDDDTGDYWDAQRSVGLHS